MRFLLTIMAAAVLSGAAWAADLSALAGRYRYEQYAVTLPNGRVLGLQDLGATEATLDIARAGTITLHMAMRSGKIVDQTATVVSLHIDQGRGYWIAQWPDMSYPVHADFSIVGGILTSDTRYDERADAERFGSTEHAVLRKLGSP
jgi:hypothetical protein